MKFNLIRSIAFILLGMLLGASATNVLIGKQVDHLNLQNIALQHELIIASNEIKELSEITKKKKNQTIIGIETYLILASREDLTDYDELAVKAEANDRVKKWLAPLIGQEISGLDILWIPNIIDNREIEANGNKFRLKSHLVVITEKITVYLKASKVKNESTF